MTDDLDYESLDPGIREHVRKVRALGYETTDSGDGVSKPADYEGVPPYRHVVVVLDEPDLEAVVRLNDFVREEFGPDWVAEASWVPGQPFIVVLSDYVEQQRGGAAVTSTADADVAARVTKLADDFVVFANDLVAQVIRTELVERLSTFVRDFAEAAQGSALAEFDEHRVLIFDPSLPITIEEIEQASGLQLPAGALIENRVEHDESGRRTHVWTIKTNHWKFAVRIVDVALVTSAMGAKAYALNTIAKRFREIVDDEEG